MTVNNTDLFVMYFVKHDVIGLISALRVDQFNSMRMFVTLLVYCQCTVSALSKVLYALFEVPRATSGVFKALSAHCLRTVRCALRIPCG